MRLTTDKARRIKDRIKKQLTQMTESGTRTVYGMTVTRWSSGWEIGTCRGETANIIPNECLDALATNILDFWIMTDGLGVKAA